MKCPHLILRRPWHPARGDEWRASEGEHDSVDGKSEEDLGFEAAATHGDLFVSRSVSRNTFKRTSQSKIISWWLDS